MAESYQRRDQCRATFRNITNGQGGHSLITRFFNNKIFLAGYLPGCQKVTSMV